MTVFTKGSTKTFKGKGEGVMLVREWEFQETKHKALGRKSGRGVWVKEEVQRTKGTRGLRGMLLEAYLWTKRNR